MRVVLLSAVLLSFVVGCGGAKPSLVQPTSKNRAKSADSAGAAKTSDSLTKRKTAASPEEGSGQDSREVTATEKAAPAVDAAPRMMDPTPTVPRDYDDEPTVAESVDDGGFEGDAWEEDDPREEVESLESDIVDAIEDYADDHGVESHTQRGDASCAEVCDLGRAICKSSGKICTISASRPGDGWIAGRCTWARGECSKAQERCTVCDP